MIVLMKCVAEAVMAKGVRGLFEFVPGGAYLFDVAATPSADSASASAPTELREEVLSRRQRHDRGGEAGRGRAGGPRRSPRPRRPKSRSRWRCT